MAKHQLTFYPNGTVCLEMAPELAEKLAGCVVPCDDDTLAVKDALSKTNSVRP